MTDTTIVTLVLLMGGFFWLVTWLPSLDMRQTGDEWVVPAEVAAVESPIEVTDEVLVRAREQYLFTCAKCHGWLADGFGPMYQLLLPRARNFSHPDVQNNSDGELFHKIYVGRGDMPEYGSRATETEIWELVAYVRATPHLPGYYNETNPDDVILNPGQVTTASPDTTVTPIPLIQPDR